MGKRFGDTPEDKSYPGTATEQHRIPAEGTEFRLFIVLAKFDASESAHGNPDAESDESNYGQDIEPSKIMTNPTHELPGNLAERVTEDGTENNNADCDKQRP